MSKSLMMMACATLFLTGCGDRPAADKAPRFEDVQRTPPKLQHEESVDYLIQHERPLAEWIAETAIACEEYGCRI